MIDTIVTPTAGTEKQLLALINEIDRTRFEPFLVCLYMSDWMNRQNFTFPVRSFSLTSKLTPGYYINFWRLRNFLKKEKFDILQTFFKESNIVGTIAGRLAGIPAIIASRRNIGYELKSWHRALFRLLRHWTNYYLANSRAVADWTEEVEKADSDRIKIIYNGLNLERFRGEKTELRQQKRRDWKIEDKELLIGAVANLRPVKNIELFIETAGKLRKEFNHLKFVVVGEGPQRENYLRMIKDKHLKSVFLLPGQSDNIPDCLAAFDMAIMTSRSESFSNSLIEYMVAGLPIVVSHVGGNSEAISHNHNGLLFELSEKDGLEKNLRKLINDPQLAYKLGKTAREEAWRKYSHERCLRETEKFYVEIAAGHCL